MCPSAVHIDGRRSTTTNSVCDAGSSVARSCAIVRASTALGLGIECGSTALIEHMLGDGSDRGNLGQPVNFIADPGNRMENSDEKHLLS